MTAPAEPPGELVSLDEFDDLRSDPLQMRLDQAVADIRGACGWHIAPPRTETVVLDGPGRSVLLLPSLHVSAVSSVVEDGRDLVDGIDYQWSEKGMLRRRNTLWTANWRGVTVTFTHGYDTVPAELVALIFDVATAAAAVPVGQQPEKMGPFEFGGAAGVRFASHEQAIIDRYTIPTGPA